MQWVILIRVYVIKGFDIAEVCEEKIHEQSHGFVLKMTAGKRVNKLNHLHVSEYTLVTHHWLEANIASSTNQSNRGYLSGKNTRWRWGGSMAFPMGSWAWRPLCIMLSVGNYIHHDKNITNHLKQWVTWREKHLNRKIQTNVSAMSISWSFPDRNKLESTTKKQKTFSDTLDRSLMYNKINWGSSIEPWCTPKIIVFNDGLRLAWIILKILFLFVI